MSLSRKPELGKLYWVSVQPDQFELELPRVPKIGTTFEPRDMLIRIGSLQQLQGVFETLINAYEDLGIRQALGKSIYHYQILRAGILSIGESVTPPIGISVFSVPSLNLEQLERSGILFYGHPLSSKPAYEKARNLLVEEVNRRRPGSIPDRQTTPVMEIKSFWN